MSLNSDPNVTGCSVTCKLLDSDSCIQVLHHHKVVLINYSGLSVFFDLNSEPGLIKN